MKPFFCALERATPHRHVIVSLSVAVAVHSEQNAKIWRVISKTPNNLAFVILEKTESKTIQIELRTQDNMKINPTAKGNYLKY